MDYNIGSSHKIYRASLALRDKNFEYLCMRDQRSLKMVPFDRRRNFLFFVPTEVYFCPVEVEVIWLTKIVKKEIGLTRYKKPDRSPPGYPPCRLLIIVNCQVNWFACVQRSTCTSCRILSLANPILKVKGKVFPYSLPSVGPGADPGVQAVSPQVT